MKVNQLKAGVALSYLSQAIQILSGLIYTPIMLRLLGQSEYGLYQLVCSVVAYLSLLSLGFGAGYMRFYSREKAKNNEAVIAKLNGMFMTIYLVISVICIVCGAIMIINIEHIFAEGLTASEYSKARVLLSLMVFNMAVSFPSSLFDSVITANEKFVFQKVIILMQNLLNPFICLPLLIAGLGSVSMVVVSTVFTVLKLVITAYFCIKKLQMRFIFRGFQFGLLKEMWVFTFFIFLNQIIDQINWNVDKFLLGRFSSTVAVAVYGLGGQINSMYLQFSTAVSNVFVPRVNQMVAEQREDSEISELFIKVGRVQFIILMLILSGFIFFGEPFMVFWGGEAYRESYGVALLLIAPVTVPLIQNLGIEIQRAKNMHRARSVVYFIISVANVGISIPLVQAFGPKGAALGTAISLALGNILFMNWYYSRKIGLDIRKFWKEMMKFIPALIPCAIVGTLIMRYLPIYHVPIMLLGIVVYTIVYWVSMWHLGLNTYEKDLVIAAKARLRKTDDKCSREEIYD